MNAPVYKSILVPLDLEKPAWEGFQFAARMADEMLVSTTLLHVVPLNIFPLADHTYDQLFSECQERLRSLSRRFFKCPPRLRVRFGNVHAEILVEARESNPGMIVLTLSEVRRRKRLLGYGTVERVVREAPCWTLVLSEMKRNAPEQSAPFFTPSRMRASRDFLSCL